MAQRTITMHGVDFEVEFDPSGDIEALYIGGAEVTDVISDLTKDALRSVVSRNASTWFAEYHREMADAARNYRRTATC